MVRAKGRGEAGSGMFERRALLRCRTHPWVCHVCLVCVSVCIQTDPSFWNDVEEVEKRGVLLCRRWVGERAGGRAGGGAGARARRGTVLYPCYCLLVVLMLLLPLSRKAGKRRCGSFSPAADAAFT